VGGWSELAEHHGNTIQKKKNELEQHTTEVMARLSTAAWKKEGRGLCT
jgi:hypothetical protein